MAGSIHREVHRIERVVPDDVEAVRRGPREDAVLVAIDEVERAFRINRRTRDRMEA